MIKIKKLLATLLLGILAASFSLSIPADPDLGWELKYGETIVRNLQIPKGNTFSMKMPDYQWVNHSWGSDVIIYFLFNNFGFLGLIIAGALVAAITVNLFTEAANLSIPNKIILTPPVLYLVSPLNNGTFRPQLVSLALLGILSYLLNQYDNKGKKWVLYFTVPLFFVWANLHGQFILGLGIYLLWIFFYLAKFFINRPEKERVGLGIEFMRLGVTFLLSTLVILANPFGIGVFTEALRHLFNPNLKFVVEWHPLEMFSRDWWLLISTGAVLSWSSYSIAKSEKLKNFLPTLGILAFLFVFSFFARRYLWPFYYISLPPIGFLLNKYLPELEKNFNAVTLVGLSLFFVIILFTKQPFSQYSSYSWEHYCKIRLCSPGVVEVLIEKNLNTDPNLLTQYDLGGWLIWNYPEVRPTIDGRMTLWEDENGYSAFSEYILLENNVRDIDQSEYDIALVSIGKPMTKRLAQLSIDGKWELVYGDDYSAIFSRKK